MAQRETPITRRPRVATGIEGLDPLIGGGFEKGKVYLITGESGGGNTIFSMQYLVKGIERGENGIFVTVDEKPEHLIEDAASLGWDLQSMMDEKHMCMLDITHHFEDARSGKDKRIDIRKIMADLKHFISDIDAKRVVIDPIAPLVIYSGMDVRDYIRSLVFALDGLGCTSLMTSEIPIGSNTISRFGVEELFASGVIVMGFARQERTFERTILIRKMRGTKIGLHLHSYTIEQGAGISIVS
ncbi:MAG: ATPase domain-containing protein [Candidatus Bathyarchaeota archaeon]